MSTPFYIAKKYFFTKKKTSAANFINITAILGIVVGTAALFVILSTFSGFEKLTIESIFTKKSTLKIQPAEGKVLTVTPELEKKLKEIPEIVSVSSIIEEKIQMIYKGYGEFVYLRAVDNNYIKTNLDSMQIYGIFESDTARREMITIKEAQKSGYFNTNDSQILVSSKTSQKLNILFQDSLKFYVPKKGKIKQNSPLDNFVIEEGVFNGVFLDEEEPAVYTSINFGRKLLEMKPNQTYALDIQHNKKLDDEVIKTKIEAKINGNHQYKILTQKDQMGSFYKMLKTENVMVYLIFTLILIISTFNLIGSIIILIIEKREDLTTLQALGMDFSSIKRIFFLEGFMVTFIGGFTGLILGLIIVLLQQQMGWVRVNEAIPYPVDIKLINFLIVVSTVIIIGYFAAKLGTLKLTQEFLKK